MGNSSTKSTHPLLQEALSYIESNNADGLRTLLKNSKLTRKLLNSKLDSDGRTLFYIACRDGKDKTVAVMLADQRFIVEFTISNGFTPFSEACNNSHLPVIQLLMQDERIQVESTRDGYKTPFYSACKKGDLPVARELMKRKSVRYSRNVESVTKDHKNLDILKAFFEFPDFEPMPDLLCVAADAYALNDEQVDAIISIIDFLLSKGLKINQRDLRGRTALHNACRHRISRVIEYLLTVPAIDINKLDKEGKPPIYYALDELYSEKTESTLDAEMAAIIRMFVKDERFQVNTGLDKYYHPLGLCDRMRTASAAALMRDRNLIIRPRDFLSACQFASVMMTSPERFPRVREFILVYMSDRRTDLTQVESIISDISRRAGPIDIRPLVNLLRIGDAERASLQDMRDKERDKAEAEERQRERERKAEAQKKKEELAQEQAENAIKNEWAKRTRAAEERVQTISNDPSYYTDVDRREADEALAEVRRQAAKFS